MVSGKLYVNFIAPPCTFSFIGFEWLQPLPGNGMYYWFAGMALLALLIMTGILYRLAMPAFAVMWTAVYLMQKSDYNNHYYLLLLLCWLMCFMPAAARFSLGRNTPAVTVCPRWVYWLLWAQMLIIYFYAALNKFDPDWLSGRFVSLQFKSLSTHRFVGPIYANRFFQLFICYAGLLFDAFIIPLLLWKRTRTYAFAVYVCFHLFNSYTFYIGVFPYLSLAMALFFFSPEKLDQLVLQRFRQPEFTSVLKLPAVPKQRLLTAALLIYLAFQLLLPLRYLLYPGPVFWTEEGYRMSWKMMARIKTGRIFYKVYDPGSGQKWVINPADSFSPGHVKWMAIAPDIAWQYSQRIKKNFAAKGYPGIQIFAIDSVTLNMHAPQLLIDTSVNLAAVKWEPFRHSNWVLPLQQ